VTGEDRSVFDKSNRRRPRFGFRFLDHGKVFELVASVVQLREILVSAVDRRAELFGSIPSSL
jgi:hypothetical protein